MVTSKETRRIIREEFRRLGLATKGYVDGAPVSLAVQAELDLLLPDSFETVAKNLRDWPSTFSFTGDELTSVTYESGGSTIVKTFVYTDGNLITIVLSGDTPSGIDLTKTLTYSEDSESVVSIIRSP